MLTVDGVTKNFGGLRVLSEVTFSVEEGEVLGVIGPNGAGKTTLFNIISGFLKPTSGRVLFRGERIDGMKPNRIVRKGIGRTFQIVRPLSDLTVAQNIRAAAVFGRGKYSGNGVDDWVEEIAEMVGLSDFLHIPAGDLNLPGKKKLEFARAVSVRPDLLLLDEVMAGLIPREVDEMLATIRKVKELHGLTVIVVEHNMHVIHSLCERLVVLNFGEKIFEGIPEEAARDRKVIEAYLGVGSE